MSPELLRHLRNILCLLILLYSTAATTKADQWNLKPEERIVLLGNTFIERENEYGQLELALRLAYPEYNLSVRNLGWSGDNTLGESRAYFGPVQAGYKHIHEYVNLLKPTLVLLSYGHNAAFEGESQLPAFLQSYEKLLDDLQADGRRLVILGLTPLEPIHRPAAEVESLNQTRQLYNRQLQELCQRKKLIYVDLYDPLLTLKTSQKQPLLTDNGVHLHSAGYAIAGEAILNSLGKSLQQNEKLILLDPDFSLASKPLREKIHRKNELFFHRFRPQNETYLRGFRKHEQGQNAKEIYEFDALVETEEDHLKALTETLLRSQKN